MWAQHSENISKAKPGSSFISSREKFSAKKEEGKEGSASLNIHQGFFSLFGKTRKVGSSRKTAFFKTLLL